MKFGVRECCDVVLKAKAAQKIGNKIFYAGEPVCYFDTLKTSSMEGAATTVYAQGGRGNARLVAWEGERTVTFTMEDALISPEGFMILSGAGLIDATDKKPIYQHMTETVDISGIQKLSESNGIKIHVSELPYMPKGKGDNFAYVMLMKNGEIVSEPYIPVHYNLAENGEGESTASSKEFYKNGIDATSKADDVENMDATKCIYEDTEDGGYWITIAKTLTFNNNELNESEGGAHVYTSDIGDTKTAYDSVIIDYYVRKAGNARQIEITADKFGGNYYLEASTLFRDQNGVDMPAEFIIPNCKIQSNFTFTLASSGDPSSFTFTMDAFPDYTRFDKSKKVLASIQVIEEAGSKDLHRHSTQHEAAHDLEF